MLPKCRRREPVVAAGPGVMRERPTRIAVHAGDRVLEFFVVSAGVELGMSYIRSAVSTCSAGTACALRISTTCAGWVLVHSATTSSK